MFSQTDHDVKKAVWYLRGVAHDKNWPRMDECADAIESLAKWKEDAIEHGMCRHDELINRRCTLCDIDFAADYPDALFTSAK